MAALDHFLAGLTFSATARRAAAASTPGRRTRGVPAERAARTALHAEAVATEAPPATASDLSRQIKVMMANESRIFRKWAEFCEERGKVLPDGKVLLDARRYDDKFLKGFLAQLTLEEGLVQHVVKLRRWSGHFDKAWLRYATQYGEGRVNPGYHSFGFIIQFFDYLGHCGNTDGAGEAWVPLTQSKLVSKVKEQSRISTEHHERWEAFYQAQAQASNTTRKASPDPRSYSANVLLSFLQGQGVDVA